MKDSISFSRSKYVVYKPYPGLHLAYHAKKYLFSRRSEFQQIDIIENEAYGRMLFLDGNLQHCTFDANIFNTALCSPILKSGARSILILGGGSGQTLITLLASNRVKFVTLVDIDRMVVDACRRFEPDADAAFSDSRVEFIVGNAFEFLSETKRRFDAVAIDLTELPLKTSWEQETGKFYKEIGEKCAGRLSHWVGSVVNLSIGPALKESITRASARYLENVGFRRVFIPSFGAPQFFMRSGFTKEGQQR